MARSLRRDQLRDAHGYPMVDGSVDHLRAGHPGWTRRTDWTNCVGPRLGLERTTGMEPDLCRTGGLAAGTRRFADVLELPRLGSAFVPRVCSQHAPNEKHLLGSIAGQGR